MNSAIIYLTTSGKPVGWTSDERTIVLSEGEAYVLLTENIDHIDNYYVDLQTLRVIRKPEKPANDYNVWDYQSKQWIIDLGELSSNIRKQRDILLGQSDWTQGSDVPDNIKNAWVQYRQQLRDLTLQPGFPAEITWPTPPEI